MSPERWRRVEDVYHSALERDPDARGDFLAAVCEGDSNLRCEVESLLRQTEAVSSILDRSVSNLLERAELAPGQDLGPYRVLETIGQGGMGRVYKALDVRLGRTVAIKVSRAEFSGRFRREARAVAALNHPNICTLYDIGPNYLVMEYVEGAPVRGPMTLADALKHGADIAGALDAAHRKGIVHRDLKPANILLTESGPKLLDFGLAKLGPGLAGAAVESVVTGTVEGAIAGTLQYMSPEQLQGRETDSRSDIFSFGLVLYEMLTGHQAFQADNAASLIAAVLTEKPDVRKHLPLVPESLARVLDRTLAKDPDERWQSARDLKAALELAQTTPTQAPGPAATKAWDGPKSWVLITALSAAVTAFLVWALWAPTPRQRAAAVRASKPDALAASASTSSARVRLTWFDRSGVELRTIGPVADYSNPAISADGRKLAVSIRGVEGKRDIWVFDLKNGGTTRMTSRSGDNTNPVWSPDGSAIVYCSDRRGQRDIYFQPLSRTGPERMMLRSNTNKNPLDWSHDGGSLIYNAERTAGGFDLFSLPIREGETIPQAFIRSSASHDWAERSPDGRWCIYRSGGHDTASLALRPLTRDGQELDLCSGGCQEAHWRADSREAYFISRGYMMLQQVRAGASASAMPEAQPLFRVRNVLASGRNTFAVSPEGEGFLILTQ
jgi:serine/threonine protein kinase